MSGHLKIAALPLSIPAWSHVEPAVEEEGEEAVLAPAAVPEAEHWIKLQIVDDDTNEPVKGVSMKIKLPSGEVKQFKADSNGTIEIKGVPEGTWDIEEMIDSYALEVVEVG